MIQGYCLDMDYYKPFFLLCQVFLGAVNKFFYGECNCFCRKKVSSDFCVVELRCLYISCEGVGGDRTPPLYATNTKFHQINTILRYYLRNKRDPGVFIVAYYSNQYILIGKDIFLNSSLITKKYSIPQLYSLIKKGVQIMTILYWIINTDSKVPIIVMRGFVPYQKSTIGPYWTYEEAIQVLHRWSK